MRDGVAALRSAGAEIRVPSFLTLIADVNERLRRPAQGLEAVKEALAGGAPSRQPCWDAELHRLEGALILHTESARARGGASPETESCFLRAIEIARRQRAKVFELRAATSLGRLWMSRGRTRDARAMLEKIHDWFSEGFENPDLTDAGTLLETLGATRRGRRRRHDEPRASNAR